MIVTVDGGPDKNPRYEKNINCSNKQFIENGLDTFFLATNAPGCRAFNHVECRMVKLSKKLSGVVTTYNIGTKSKLCESNSTIFDDSTYLHNPIKFV